MKDMEILGKLGRLGALHGMNSEEVLVKDMEILGKLGRLRL